MENIRSQDMIEGRSKGHLSTHVIGVSMLMLLSVASCARQPMLADASDAIRQTATDATTSPALDDGADIQRAAADAARIYAHRTGCPAVRVRRADVLTRGDGLLWLVVRLNACGEERVYERTPTGPGWSDATARLR